MYLPLCTVERVIGANHLRVGKPCQDEVGLLQHGGMAAIAIADGHGSSPHADVGARIAVTVTLRSLLCFVEDIRSQDVDLAAIQAYAKHPFRVQLTRDWAERVRAYAGRPDVDLVDYGSTLLFALATETFLLLGQIGDGDILIVSEKGDVEVPILTDPAAVGDETRSLCEPESWGALRVRTIPPPKPASLLLLSTDGYSKSYTNDADFRKIGPDYLDRIQSYSFQGLIPHLGKFLTEATMKGSGDDIALGMLYWPPEGGASDSSMVDAQILESVATDQVSLDVPAIEPSAAAEENLKNPTLREDV